MTSCHIRGILGFVELAGMNEVGDSAGDLSEFHDVVHETGWHATA
jgi:hypothetical protein